MKIILQTLFAASILIGTASSEVIYRKSKPVICTPKSAVIGLVEIDHKPESFGGKPGDQYEFFAAQILHKSASCLFKNTRTGYIEYFKIFPKENGLSISRFETEGPWKNGPWSSGFQYRYYENAPQPVTVDKNATFCTQSAEACIINPVISMNTSGMSF